MLEDGVGNGESSQKKPKLDNREVANGGEEPKLEEKGQMKEEDEER